METLMAKEIRIECAYEVAAEVENLKTLRTEILIALFVNRELVSFYLFEAQD